MSQSLGAAWGEPAEAAYYLAARWRRRRVLDLGCGAGRHALFFAREGFAVDAFDLSESGVSLLQKAAQQSGRAIPTQVGDMRALPYASGSFGGVLAFHVVYHTDREGIERVLAEVHRVLVEWGEVYLTFNSKSNPSFREPSNRRVDDNTVIKTKGPEAGVPHYYVDEPEVRRLMSAFQVLKLAHTQGFLENRSRWHYFVLAQKA